MLTKVVLIVDDNADVRIIFSAILNYDGYHVIEAENGAIGVAAAVKHRPDLILMDIAMPVLNGFDAALQLHGLSITKSIPIVAVTGNEFTSEQLGSAAALFVGYLLKPITPRGVLAEVQRLIGAPHMNDN
jgi:two-component system, cell cycle response regulator DivK